MKTFHCTHCQNLVFFENVVCLSCQRNLTYLPDRQLMAALEADAAGQWQYEGETYKLCSNYVQYQVCNWALPTSDPEALCASCRLTHIIPDLSVPENVAAWHRLEMAKRRLIYTLLMMGLPLVRKSPQEPGGVEFEFLKDSAQPNGDLSRVLTGHDNGLITINVAEADDVYREQQRTQQNEPYRTLLGHFRHEIGHYYWDRLILNTPQQARFRELFGDESRNYQAALDEHYRNGPPANWENDFISAYASTHPWEDWAESWAHVMHMIDALETAACVGVSIKPRRADEPAMAKPQPTANPGFETMIQAWLPLTYALNSFTRGLGLQDTYPFVLSERVLTKLRFVYDTIYRDGTFKNASAART